MTLYRTADGRHDWRSISRLAAHLQIGVASLLALSFAAGTFQGISQYYFFSTDLPLLLLSAAALLGLVLVRPAGRPVAPLSPRQLAAVCALLVVMTYAACFLVFHHYAMSRDEQSAEFAAGYLASGHLARTIPAPLRDLGRAMMPLYTDVRPTSWASSYLPVNAAIRALFAWAGDQWLAGPVLLAIGVAALWSSTRRIWPERPHAATVAVTMVATSAQVLLAAATPYAMTAHFTLNALWLAFFLRGGRAGHGAAIATGFLATGLHQAHFHIVLALSFALWLLWDRRYRLALCYGSACLAYWIAWRVAYPDLIATLLGEVVPDPFASASPGHVATIISRLVQLQPGESLTRFVAWQNILLLPLALVAVTAIGPARRGHVTTGCAIACGIGMLTPIVQDHGLGYRYLHHLLPFFAILAAGGWLELERVAGEPLSRHLLSASVAFAALVTLPLTTWQTMAWSAPFERAYRAVSSAPADIVLVDPRAGAYVESIIRVDPVRRGPVLLDLGYVPAATLRRLCRTSRTMLFSDREARELGLPANLGPVIDEDAAAARSARLAEWNCATPVPV